MEETRLVQSPRFEWVEREVLVMEGEAMISRFDPSGFPLTMIIL
jgi:hypothetical protein